MSTDPTRRSRGPLSRILAEGEDPDPRFTLANERTYLAWVRTSLALLAGGIGLEAFVVDLPEGLRRGLAAVLVLMGGMLAVGAFARWMSVERAMRTRRSLPLPRLLPVLSGGLGLSTLVLLVFVLARG